MKITVLVHEGKAPALSIESETAEQALAAYYTLVAGLGLADDPTVAAPEAEPTRRPGRPRNQRGTPEPVRSEPAPEPEPVKTEPPVTQDQVRAAANALIQLGNEGAKAAIDIVLSFKAFNDLGQPKIEAMQPADYAPALAMFEAKRAEILAAKEAAAKAAVSL